MRFTQSLASFATTAIAISSGTQPFLPPSLVPPAALPVPTKVPAVKRIGCPEKKWDANGRVFCDAITTTTPLAFKTLTVTDLVKETIVAVKWITVNTCKDRCPPTPTPTPPPPHHYHHHHEHYYSCSAPIPSHVRPPHKRPNYCPVKIELDIQSMRDKEEAEWYREDQEWKHCDKLREEWLGKQGKYEDNHQNGGYTKCTQSHLHPHDCRPLKNPPNRRPEPPPRPAPGPPAPGPPVDYLPVAPQNHDVYQSYDEYRSQEEYRAYEEYHRYHQGYTIEDRSRPPEDSQPDSGRRPSGIICPNANNSTYSGFTVQCFNDYFGGDLFSDSAYSFRECMDKCRATPDCLAVAYHPGEQGECYLKSSVGPSVYKGDIWGARLLLSEEVQDDIGTRCPDADDRRYKTRSGAIFRVECGVDREGGDMDGNPLYVSGLEECMTACSARRNCIVVSLLGRACYLKDERGRSRIRDDVWGARLVKPRDGHRPRGYNMKRDIQKRQHPSNGKPYLSDLYREALLPGTNDAGWLPRGESTFPAPELHGPEHGQFNKPVEGKLMAYAEKPRNAERHWCPPNGPCDSPVQGLRPVTTYHHHHHDHYYDQCGCPPRKTIIIKQGTQTIYIHNTRTTETTRYDYRTQYICEYPAYCEDRKQKRTRLPEATLSAVATTVTTTATTRSANFMTLTGQLTTMTAPTEAIPSPKIMACLYQTSTEEDCGESSKTSLLRKRQLVFQKEGNDLSSPGQIEREWRLRLSEEGWNDRELSTLQEGDRRYLPLTSDLNSPEAARSRDPLCRMPTYYLGKRNSIREASRNSKPHQQGVEPTMIFQNCEG